MEGNGPNQAHAVEADAVPVLTELINDEDDDELSQKAFECLQALGPRIIQELMKYYGLALKKVSGEFVKTKTILVDLYR